MIERILTYKHHSIWVYKIKKSDDWYIQVSGPDGCMCYDGWWGDSSDRTADEAIEEAKSGACIDASQSRRMTTQHNEERS